MGRGQGLAVLVSSDRWACGRWDTFRGTVPGVTGAGAGGDSNDLARAWAGLEWIRGQGWAGTVFQERAGSG